MANTPLYINIRRELLDCLAKGTWQPGDCLPSEPQLAGRFKVSISTIRAAIADLASTGVLHRIQGKGTYVTTHDLHRERYHFSNLHDKTGGKVLTKREVLGIRKKAAGTRMSTTLQLNKRQPRSIFQIITTLNVNRRPVALMKLYLPVWLFPNFQDVGLNQTEENLYAVFQKQYGVTVIRMEEKVYAGLADAEQARLLRIAKGSSVLHVDRVSYSFNDIPVELRQRVFIGHEHYYLYSQRGVD